MEVTGQEVIQGSTGTMTCTVTGISKEPEKIVWVVGDTEYEETEESNDTSGTTYTVSSEL